MPPTGNCTSITSIGEDAEGELLISTQWNGVFKVVPAGPAAATNLGFGTPGTGGVIPRFRVCGILTPGSSAEFTLDRAQPFVPVAILLGLQNNPTAIPPFGTILPFPILIAIGMPTDGSGLARLSVPTGLSSFTFFGQCAAFDPAGGGGLALSNALQIVVP